MSKPFKMRGPTFFKSAIKSYSPTKQGTALGAAQGGENIESTFGGAIGSGPTTPTTGPVEDTDDQKAAANTVLAEKRAAAGGGKYQPGGGPGQSAARMKSPAKQSNVKPNQKFNPDWQGMAPKPQGTATASGGASIGSATPKKSPNKQVEARPENMTARAIGKHEQMLRRAAQSGPLEKKSPAKQGPTQDEIKSKYRNYKDYKKAVKKGHVKKGSLGETSPATSPAKADPTWDEVKGKYDSYAAYKNMRKNAGLRANPNNPNA